MSLAAYLFAAVVLCIAIVPLAGMWRRDKENLSQLRRQAHEQFLSVVVKVADSRYSFNGSTAVVVSESETMNCAEGVVYNYTMTRFAYNEDGEYFMFMSNPQAPYVKHIEHKVAQLVLKNAYIAPARMTSNLSIKRAVAGKPAPTDHVER